MSEHENEIAFEIVDFRIDNRKVLALAVNNGDSVYIGGEFEVEDDGVTVYLDETAIDNLKSVGAEGFEESIAEDLAMAINEASYSHSKISIDKMSDFEVQGEGEYATARVQIAVKDSLLDDEFVLDDVQIAIGHLPHTGGFNLEVEKVALGHLSERFSNIEDFEYDIYKAVNDYLGFYKLGSLDGASQSLATTVINSISMENSWGGEKLEVNSHMVEVLTVSGLPSDLVIEPDFIDNDDEGYEADAGCFTFSIGDKDYVVRQVEMNDSLYSNDPVFIADDVESKMKEAGVPEYVAEAIGKAADSIWRMQMDVEKRMNRQNEHGNGMEM